MKSRKKLFILTIALIGIVLSAMVYKNVQSSNESEKRAHHESEHDHGEDQHEKNEHDEHEEHMDHDNERAIHLSNQDMKEFDIEVAKAGPGKIDLHIELPGEIALNEDRLAHVVPRVSGIVREVRKFLGDRVRKGEVMAVLESRELADAKAAFLASRERLSLAQANFIREERLWNRKISSEQEYLEAKRTFAEAKIELRSSEQKLHALGFSEKFLEKLPSQPDISFTRYRITAPFDGTVIEKHIVLGEVLKDDSKAYVVADLNSLWVNISVYQKDLPFIRKRLPVIISAGYGIPDVKGKISYIGPLVSEKTRTALARVVLPNPKGNCRPGMFITARIAVDKVEVPIMVPKSALVELDGETNLFIKEEEDFSPKHVTVGRTDGQHAEITFGISPGQIYVTKGAFTLKAQLSKGTFGDGHAH